MKLKRNFLDIDSKTEIYACNLFSLECRRRKNSPCSPQQISSPNLGASRPTSTLQDRGPTTPTPNPETPKETPRLHDFFRKVRVNFCLLPCGTNQEADRNCSQKLVKMNYCIVRVHANGYGAVEPGVRLR